MELRFISSLIYGETSDCPRILTNNVSFRVLSHQKMLCKEERVVLVVIGVVVVEAKR